MTALTQHNDAAQSLMEASAGAGEAVYVKFNGNSGDYVLANDAGELEHGDQFAVAVTLAKWSWTFWWEGQPLEKVEEFVVKDPSLWQSEPDFLPDSYDEEMSLEDIRTKQKDRDSNFNDGWSLQVTMPMAEIGGMAEEYVLRLNSKGAVRAFRGFLGAVGKKMRFHPGKLPIVEIGAASYNIKKVGKKYSPTFKLVDWISEEDLYAAAGENADEYASEEAEGPAALPAPDEKPAEVEKAAEKPAEAEESADAGDAEEKPRGRAARGRRGRSFG